MIKKVIQNRGSKSDVFIVPKAGAEYDFGSYKGVIKREVVYKCTNKNCNKS